MCALDLLSRLSHLNSQRGGVMDLTGSWRTRSWARRIAITTHGCGGAIIQQQKNTTKTQNFFYPQKDLFTRLLCKKKCRNHRAVSQTQEEETEDEKRTHDVWRWIIRLVILPSAFSFFAHLSFYLPWSMYRHHASALVFALSWLVIAKVHYFGKRQR